ncbi:MAG: hypothetical protein ILO68_02360, partial [Clostridia bacterium]|nr:hypothetical protein [Clostridia bacterium]
MRHPARHLLKSGIRSLRKPLSALVLVLLLTSVLLPAAMIPSAASESAPVSGAALSLSCDGASALEISGRSFSPLSPEDAVIRAVVTVSDSSSGYSRILLNGKEIADLKDGENRIEIPVRDLVQGDNRLGIRLGCGDRTYTDTVVYGRVNLDDILVESVRFEQTSFTRPSKSELWMPVEGASGKTVRTDPYTDRLTLGDGWFESTGLGGNTPDVPVAADFLFPYPDLTGRFLIDTTELPDGETEFVFRAKDGSVLETRAYFVDNTGPKVTFSHPSGAVLGRMDSLTCEVTDNSGKTIHTKFVDGEKVARVRLDKLPAGGHSFSVEAEDKSGNKTRTTMLFTVAERAYGWNGESGALLLPEDANAYEAALLRTVRMYGNSYGTWDKNRLRTDDEVLLPIDEYPVTRSADGSNPYQSFLVKVDDPDAKEVLISYTGITGNGVPILLRA